MIKLSRPRSRRGNMTLITVSVIGFFSFLIFSLVFFYNSKLLQYLEVKTAADAAAITAAKLMPSATVVCKLGHIGLVDMDAQDENNPLKKANPKNAIPILGYNTALATIRLDMQIANDIGNQDMLDLAYRDLDTLKSAGKELGQQLTKLFAESGSLKQAVVDAYNANANRSTHPGLTSLEIIPGRLENGKAVSNINLENPTNLLEAASGINGKYKAYTNLPLLGKNMAFAAIGDQSALVSAKEREADDEPIVMENVPVFIPADSSEYEDPTYGYVPPTMVMVIPSEAAHTETTTNEKGEVEQTVHNITQVSVAELGAGHVINRSTAYTIGFAGSFPSKKAFPQLTVKALLDYKGWQTPSQSGTWLKSANGEFPGSNLQETEFPASKGNLQTPSTALAYGLYDWLRSLGLRPKRSEVVNFITNTDLRTISGVPSQTMAAGGKVRKQDPNPTYLELTANSPEGQLSYYNAFRYSAVDEGSPEGIAKIAVDSETGNAKTLAGNYLIEMCQLTQGLIATNRAGAVSRIAGMAAQAEASQAFDYIQKPIEGTIKKAEGEKDPQKVAEVLNALKKQLGQYQMAKAVFDSPPPPPVSEAISQFTSQTITVMNAMKIKNTQLPKAKGAILGMEKPRMDNLANRGYRVALNGEIANHSTSTAMMMLPDTEEYGVRRLDAHDYYPDSPVFAVSIAGEGTFQPSLVYVEPNNSPVVTRNNHSTSDFFVMDIPTYDQTDQFRLRIMKNDDSSKLWSGSTKMPMPAGPQRWQWDGAGAPPLSRGGGTGAGMQKTMTGSYAALLPYIDDYVSGGDPSVSFVDLHTLQEDVKAWWETTGFRPGMSDQEKRELLQRAQLFVLTVNGDASSSLESNKGAITAHYVTRKEIMPTYPFSENKLLPNQYLYYSGDCLKEGTIDYSDSTKAIAYRSVMARDQFADLSKGESYGLQANTPTDWGNVFNIQGVGSPSPYPAGEWRLGHPSAMPCCQLCTPPNYHYSSNSWDVLASRTWNIPYLDGAGDAGMSNAYPKGPDCCPTQIDIWGATSVASPQSEPPASPVPSMN